MRLGIDVSTYFEELEHGAQYFDGNKVVEPLSAFRQNGVDIMRIRVWVDPRGENGEPYLAGTCDTDNSVKLAQLAQQKGYKIMLDFHYSDFWCDPGKQFLPKKWRELSLEQLVGEVYRYTVEVLRVSLTNCVEPEYIQVGNEITNGILWPVGQLQGGENGAERENYEALCYLLKAGVRACREICPNSKLMLHLERSYDQQVYNEFFTNMEKYGVDYDVIGFSYYPCWHGTFEQLFANVNMCRKFGKEEMIVETGYPFTGDDYVQNLDGDNHMCVAGNGLLPDSFSEEYPLTANGQKKFLQKLLDQAEKHGVSAVCWWEPLWIPGENICWASKAAQKYLHDESKSTRNEWANQCLFDYQGKKLPAFDIFKVSK